MNQHLRIRYSLRYHTVGQGLFYSGRLKSVNNKTERYLFIYNYGSKDRILRERETTFG